MDEFDAEAAIPSDPEWPVLDEVVSVEDACSRMHGDPDSPTVGWGLPPVLIAREAGLL